jgi:YVTN family beta-propeller protein
MPELPTGTVTFLFTDIEGSTRLLAQLRHEYPDLLANHQRLLRDAFERHEGQEIDTQGDSFFVAFSRAGDAVAAAVAAQRALAESYWPEGAVVRVRMGIHTGEPIVGGERYVGLGVHRAARICAAAHGGQVLLSGVTRGLIEDELPDGVGLRDLGEHRLKDLERSERLSQLVIEGLGADFPPPRTAGPVPLEVAGREQELAEAAGAAVKAAKAIDARRRWALAAALVLLLAGVAAAAVLLLTSGSGTGAETPGGNALAVIDPPAQHVGRYLRVGSAPSNVATGDGAVWVLDGDDLTISKIDPKAQKVVRTFSSGQIPTDLAVGGGAIWVGNGVPTSASEQVGTVYAASVSRIDLSGNTVKTSLPGRAGTNFVNFSFRIPGISQLVVGPEAVWAINPDRSVSKLDPKTGKVDLVVRGLSANAIALGDKGVWIIDNVNTIGRIDPRRGTITSKVTPAASGFIGIAVGAGSVWATDPFDGTVWRVDLGPPLVTRTVSVGVGVTGIAIGDGGVWVSNFLDGTVSRIDPATNAVVQKVPVRGTPKALAVGEGAAWLAVSRSSVSSCPLFFQGKGKPDYVIASDLPLHGVVGTLAAQMRGAIRLSLERRRFRAGRYTIGYRSCDDSTAQGGAFDFYKCAANAHAYAEDRSVIGVVGTYYSACAANQIPVLNRAKPGPLTMISPGNTDPALTHDHPAYAKQLYPTGIRNFARVVPPDDYQGAAVAVFARRLGIRRAFLLATNSAESALVRQPVIASFSRAAKGVGLEIAGRATWSPVAADYRSLARDVARSGAEGVVIADANLNGEQLIRDLRAELGRKVKIFVNYLWLPLAPIIQKTGEAMVGVYLPYYSLADSLLSTGGKGFIRQLRSKEDAPIKSFGATPAAQAAGVLLDAIARSDGTRVSVNAAIRSAHVKDGIARRFSFNSNGDIVPAPFTIFRVVGGTKRSTTNVSDFDGSVVDRAVYVPSKLLSP